MAHKAEVLAFDREKRVYKDAYVESFRRVRHFPAIASIGTGRSDGESIVLVQEAAQDEEAVRDSSNNGTRTKAIDVASRLLPKDPLDDLFPDASPLTAFRTAVMCKHTKARHDQSVTNPNLTKIAIKDPPTSAFVNRYETSKAKPLFKPSSAAEAKCSIERKATYDSECYTPPPPVGRSFAPPVGKADWAYNNPAAAREAVGVKKYFHLPPEGVVTADRRYTQEFIQQHVDAYQLSKRHHQ